MTDGTSGDENEKGEQIDASDLNVLLCGLKHYICEAFSRENEFINKFYPQLNTRLFGIDYIYMASERCIVKLKKKHTGMDAVYSETIKTIDFIDWCDEFYT